MSASSRCISSIRGGRCSLRLRFKCLLADSKVPRQVSSPAMDRFLTYYYVPGNETLFEGIRRLDPGHYLTVQDGQVDIRRFWDLRFDVQAGPLRFDKAVDRAPATVTHQCQGPHDQRRAGWGPAERWRGFYWCAAVRSRARLQPTSDVYGRFCRRTIRRRAPVREIGREEVRNHPSGDNGGVDEFREFLPRYVWHMEEPVCEPPAIALFFVSQLARQSSVKVLLSGEGGDEAFGGYPEYRNLLIFEGLKSKFGPAMPLFRWVSKVWLAWAGSGVLGMST